MSQSMERMLRRTLLWAFVMTLAISTAIFISFIARESVTAGLGHFLVLTAPVITVLVSWRFFRIIPVLLITDVVFVIAVVPMYFSYMFLYFLPFLLLTIVTIAVVTNAITNRLRRTPGEFKAS